MKKYISLLLIILLMFCIPCSANTTSDVTEEKKEFSEAKQVVKNLGIYDAYTEKDLTRGRFAEVILSMIGDNVTDASVSEDMLYTDVSSDNKYYSAIKSATDYGYLRGFGDGSFRPDEKITLTHMTGVFIKILGYNMVYTDYSQYNSLARTIGLHSNIDAYADDFITPDNAAMLIFNTLKAGKMVFSELSDTPSYTVDKSSPLLIDVFNTREARGFVNSDEYINLTGSTLPGDGYVFIDKSEYFANGIENLLGKNIRFYYRTDDYGKRSLLSAVDLDSMYEMIDISDVVSFSTNAVQYENDENKFDYISVNPDAYVIYNGRYENIFQNFDFNILNKQAGYIEFLDSDRDGKYDIVVIKDYCIYAVDMVGSEQITFKYGATFKQKNYLRLDLDNDSFGYKIIVDGEVGTLGDFMEYDVINVAMSRDGEFCEINLKFKRLDGEITEMGTKDGKPTIVVNGEECIVSAAYLQNPEYEPFELGDTGEFYCDYNGEVASFKENENVNSKYGYLVAVSDNEGPFEQDYRELKIFTQDGAFEVIKTLKRIDLITPSYPIGRKVECADLKTELLTTNSDYYQFVMYETNSENIITKIITLYDTLKDKQGLKDAGVFFDYKDDKEYGDYPFTANFYGTNGQHTYTRVITGLMGDRFRIDSLIPIFSIPGDKSNEKLYGVQTAQDVLKVNSTFENIKLCNVDEFDWTPKMAYMEADAAVGNVVQELQNVGCMVDSFYKGINEAGEAVDYITLWEGNNKKSFWFPSGDDEPASMEKLKDNDGIESDWYYGTKISDLKRGDIIQYETDAADASCIYAIRVLFKENDRRGYHMEAASLSEKWANALSVRYTSPLHFAYGEVTKIKSGILQVQISPNGDKWSFFVAAPAVLIYDSQTDSIKKGSLSDIVPGDKVTVRRNYKVSPQEVYIYR